MRGGFLNPQHNPTSLLWLHFVDEYTDARRFSGDSAVKQSACNAEEAGDTGSIPGSGRSSGWGNGKPVQCSCLKNSHGKRSLEGYKSMGSQRVGQDWETMHARTLGLREVRWFAQMSQEVKDRDVSTVWLWSPCSFHCMMCCVPYVMCTSRIHWNTENLISTLR